MNFSAMGRRVPRLVTDTQMEPVSYLSISGLRDTEHAQCIERD
jgi:hypothetical protein